MNYNQLRLRQMFSPTFEQEGVMSSDQGKDVSDLYDNDIIDTTMQDRFRRMAEQAPQRKDYQLSGVGRIGAALAGMGAGGPAGMWGGNPVGYRSNVSEGLDIQQRLQNRPYNEAATEYNQRITPIRQAADDEQNANVNRRIMTDNERARRIQQNQYERQVKRDEQLATDAAGRQSVAEGKLSLDREKVEIARAKANGAKFYPDTTTGKLVGLTPDGREIQTNVSHGDLSDMEKFSIQLGNAEELENLRQQNRMQLETQQQQGRVDLKTTSPAVNPNVSRPRPLSESQNVIADRRRIMQAINQKPELKKYFKFGTNNQPTGEVLPPGMFGNDALYKEAQAIAGGSIDQLSSTPQVQTGQPKVGDIKTFPNGKVGKWDGKGWVAQ